MRSTLHVDAVDPQRPSEAVAAAVLPGLRMQPYARARVLALTAWGDGPGLGPAPWVLEGVLKAMSNLGSPKHHVIATVLGAGMRGDLDRRLAGAQIPAELRPDIDDLSLTIPGVRLPLRIPARWLGANLCLAIPLVHMATRGASSHSIRGPVAAAAAALTRSVSRAPASADDAEHGLRVIAEVFASVQLIIDASWWATMSPGATTAAELLAVERIVASEDVYGVAQMRAIDGWLSAQMGLRPLLSGTRSHLRVSGAAASRPWPLARIAPVPRLDAGRIIEAIWHPGQRARSRPTLPPSVPGPLARTWDHYADRPAIA